LFALLLLNPVLYSGEFSRFYRDQLVTALALLAFGIALALGRAVSAAQGRPDVLWVISLLVSVLLGAVVGWVRITRSDTVWVTVAVIMAIVAIAAHSVMVRRWTALLAVLVTIVGAGVSLLPSAYVAAQNNAHYSVALEDDYSQGAFADAIRTWASVSGGEPFVVINKEQRDRVYAVSPSARTLQAYLENPSAPWRHTCTSDQDLYPCEEFMGFIGWALRDATVNGGRVHSASDFQMLFRRIDNDITSACANGALKCGARAVSADVPPLDRLSRRAFVAAFSRLATVSLTGPVAGWAQPGYAGVEPADLTLWKSTVNGANQTYSLLSSGEQRVVISQSDLVGLVTRVYQWLALPMVLLAIVGLFSRELWRNTLGWIAIAAVVGWLVNLGILALFFSSTRRVDGPGLYLYTMASQAMFLTGVSLAAVIGARTARRWVAVQILVRPESATDDPMK
jgi:hypothetical protein